MKFNVRRLEESDYETLVKWWEAWGWQPISKDFLPGQGTDGIIIFDKKIPICAGFLYTTNSKIGWINFIVSNKEYRKKPQRKKAIILLLKSLIALCKDANIKYIYSNNNNNHLINHFESLGFNKTTDKMTELIKII